MDYKQKIADKRQATASHAEKRQNLDELISQLKEVQLAALMGAGTKSTVILADSTDLGVKVAELGDKIVQVLDAFKKDTAATDKLSVLQAEFKKLNTAISKQASDQATNANLLVDAVSKAIAAVKIPVPSVSVQGSKVDLAPIREALRELNAPKLDLSAYRAHDINDSDKDTQYIGFLNPAGNWYIIENDVKGGKLRYVFGSGGYTKAFAKAGSYSYGLLSEAVNALPS